MDVMPRRRFILFGAIAVFILAGVWAFRFIRGSGMETADEMRASLLKIIPVGTPVSEAETLLQNQGFEVQRMTNASFVENDKLREHIDYLYGNMSEGIVVQRRWQVSIVHDQNAVREISVSTSLVGP